METDKHLYFLLDLYLYLGNFSVLKIRYVFAYQYKNIWHETIDFFWNLTSHLIIPGTLRLFPTTALLEMRKCTDKYNQVYEFVSAYYYKLRFFGI